MTTQKKPSPALTQVKQLYTEFTGTEISQAIAQVRQELTAQQAYLNSTESVQTFRYRLDIQEILDKLPVDTPAEE
jgi:hypothetical protein